jgi:hypothetical protein
MRKILINAACILGAVLSQEEPIPELGGTYNYNTGLKAMYYSAASYCNKATVQDWTCGEPCETQTGTGNITQINNEGMGTFGYVGYNS